MNNEVEGMWKEAVVGYFKALARNLLRGTKENHEKPQLVYPSFGSKFEQEICTMTFGV